MERHVCGNECTPACRVSGHQCVADFTGSVHAAPGLAVAYIAITLAGNEHPRCVKDLGWFASQRFPVRTWRSAWSVISGPVHSRDGSCEEMESECCLHCVL